MRKITIDNKRVVAPNARLIGSATRVVKRGSYFITTSGMICRSLGRIASCDSDGTSPRSCPYDAQTMRRLMNHGTTQEQFIDAHKDRVALFAERDRPQEHA